MRLNILTKLLGGFGIVLALTGAVAHDVDTMYQEGTLGIVYALKTNEQMIASTREEKRAFLTAAGEARNKLIERSREEIAEASQHMKDYEKTYASAEDRKMWEAVVAQVTHVQDQREGVLHLLEQGKDAEAKALVATMTDAVTEMNEALDGAGDANMELTTALKSDADATASSGEQLVLVASVLAVLVGLAIGFWLSRGISTA
ncbi:MAG: hypothetical protein EXR66_03410 [Dehalococcoidia bacterium]|nr:hypothetical protein [Dehalococcoidia bacterium]